ncbi:MAG: sugar phosphate nucleotidyltransferase [Rubricoccaceae bacterium]|nr:sugar phosphate nucleotidyltransferase [Rubricoccaceae bacterium]
MKLIVPMAGRGTRLRPHTHVTPKPLLPVVGRSMVERIVETFAGALPRGLDEAVFVLGPDFGDEVRRQLAAICERQGLRPHFAVQEQALGTAHAVVQAGEHLDGECVIVFADTLFAMDETPDLDADAVVWVKHVDDPRRFGVVVKDGERISAFVEKPEEPISNEAIIGIYYVRDAATLRREIDDLIEDDVRGAGGEFQLTDALDRMLKAGQTFKTASVSEWLDCGTIPALKDTTRVMLDKSGEATHEGRVENSTLIEPVFLGPDATVRDSVVGPYAAIHGKATVTGSTVKNTIVFEGATVEGSALDDAVVGHEAHVRGFAGPLNIGDHATVGVEA